jgi:hypothetical protein
VIEISEVLIMVSLRGVLCRSNLQAVQEIASVAPLLRNDSFLGEEERWRCGDTRNDKMVVSSLCLQ